MVSFKLTFRIWILIIVVALSLSSLFLTFDPFGITFLQKGVWVSSVEANSTIHDDGLRAGMRILEINGETVSDLSDYQRIMEPYFYLEENMTKKLEIQTNSINVIGLYGSSVSQDIVVRNVEKTKIQTGLDLRGGARAFLSVNSTISDSDLNDLILILEQRLNVYGLSDINIYKVTIPSGESLIGVEIAGSTPEELERLIGEQGHFIAKIGNETVFIGGDRDITHVGRTGQEAMVSECFSREGQEICNFRFVVALSPEAAQRHADITAELGTKDNCIPRYDPNCYLEKKIDFYVDDVLTSSLNIGADLKGNAVTSIQISGSEVGPTRQEAIENARQEMRALQTILITGSLPYDLEIVKIDRISANLGAQFIRQILIAGFFAIIAVTIFTFIVYRKFKVSIAIILVSFSEVLMILGSAALINHYLDLPSIAGIIAAIGIGMDSQIIILDESRNKSESLKTRIKKALFILVTAFATTFVALIPLTGGLGFLGIGAASAGLLKGFAITTLIGITVGILITRPAFADIIKQIHE